METSLDRIKRDLEILSTFSTTPGKGVTRFSYSESDKSARDYLLKQFRGLGLIVREDAVGNIRARLLGTDQNAPVVMTGSHLDTVLHGGKFDGAVGVVCGLEVIRVLKERKTRTRHSIELIIFVEEEGSNFMSTMAGSKTLIGKYCADDLKKIFSENGTSMYEMAEERGFNPRRASECVIRSGEIKAMIEMHIEQGAVLDSEKLSIGIVESIAGIKSYTVEVIGVSNHAGATPMNLRKNPMSTATKVISEIDRIVAEKANPSTVATVGKIDCFPNIHNVIPEKISFTLDVRDVEPGGIEVTIKEVEKRLIKETKHNGLKMEIKLVAETDPVKLSSSVIDVIEEEARKMRIKYKRMYSGAVHDSSLLADITSVGMIFVPSINGRSHVPEENTKLEDIKVGCDLLLRSIERLAR